MAISIITDTIPLRDPDLKWDELGPGRYPNEVIVSITSGEKIAVSVDPKWLENGAGVSLEGNARWVDDTGQTKLDPNGAHVESNLMVTVTMGDVKQFNLKPLAKDVAVVLIGEGPRLMRPADIINGVLARPVIDVDQNILNGASIKNAADLVKAATGFKLALN